MILPPVDPDIPASNGDDFDGMSPQCSACLATMEPQPTARGERWTCPQCRTSKLS